MRNLVALLCFSSLAGLASAAGCVLVTETGPGGHTSEGFGAAGPGGGGGSGGGSFFSGYVCSVPATPPSGGSCVNVSGDGGTPPDMDGGMGEGSDGGHHGWDGGSHGSGSGSGSGSSSGSGGAGSGSSGSSSSGSMSAGCNPVTNEGCSGTDVCGPDSSETGYACLPEGSPANVPLCGDCSDPETSCGVGGICIGLDESGDEAICVQMCCTDADCGSGAQCNGSAIIPSLPDGVGVCVFP